MVAMPSFCINIANLLISFMVEKIETIGRKEKREKKKQKDGIRLDAVQAIFI